MVSYGGQTPVELVFGRKPKDMFLENLSQEQLTLPDTDADQMDQTLQ